MAMNSINTNTGALVALQNLNKTNSELAVAQARINTGLKVASAKDNGAIWAIAQAQRAQMSSLNAVQESLQRGQSTVDVAMAAGSAVSDLLLQMKEKALAASDTGLDAASRTSLQTEYQELAKQIKTVVDNASFNGVNMLTNGSGGAGTSVVALASADGVGKVTVTGVNFNLGAGGLVVNSTDTFATAAAAATVAGNVDTAIANVSSKLTALGTGSKALDTQLTFTRKLSDALETGIGNLVDADLAKESAKLQALQTKQQLGIQALSIANQSSATLLSLFR